VADRRMLTKVVIAGGEPFVVRIPGAILHAECGYLGTGPRAPVTFQLWYEGSFAGNEAPERKFRTFRTGVEIPENAAYCKSARSDGGQAWHLYELFDWGDQDGLAC